MMMRVGPFVRNVLPRPFKRNIQRLIWAVQGSKGALPQFLIVGAAKAGTTSLYTYLAQHPQIIEAKVKEVQFFSVYYNKGVMWYRSKFPTKYQINERKITGEASPYYLFHPHAPKRIYKLLPNIKLIVMLRDPVDRAISHYFHELREENEFLPMEEAFRNEKKRIKPELIKMQADESYNSETYRCYSYKSRGIYVDQLIRYFSLFSKDKMLILKSEDLFSNPKGILKDVLAFLEVDAGILPNNLNPKNVGSYCAKVSSPIYKDLVNYYAPHNERLYQLLGRDFAWKVP